MGSSASRSQTSRSSVGMQTRSQREQGRAARGRRQEDEEWESPAEEEDASEEYEEESEEEEVLDEPSLFRFLGMTHSSSAAQRLARFPPIHSHQPTPLDDELAAELSQRTAALGPRTPRVGIALPRPSSAHSSDSGATASPTAGAAAAAAAAATPRGGLVSPASLLLMRETGGGPLAPAQRAHFAAFHRLPVKPSALAHQSYSRGYIGRFDATGSVFVAAFQDEKKIKVFDVRDGGWRLRKSVHARQLRWTFTDTSLSSDQRFLLYSTISSTVHLVDLQGRCTEEESVANITQIHEALQLGQGEGDRNGLWSVKWSADNREIIAGTADASVWLYDVQQGKTVVRARGHEDDVNAVAYADESPNIFFSGSDDHMVKVWDKRMLDASRGGARAQPAGVFVGHTEGITHIDSKGDSRYLISNGKDQVIRLWDVRAARSPRAASRLPRKDVPTFRWDYRWQAYPASGRVVTHPHDGSLQQFRGGHQVHSTLIRAYWSPLHTTGQRYVYCGSSDGAPAIYDVISGRAVKRLSYHQEVVRDISWHPALPLIATTSFDGSIALWEPNVAGEAEAVAEEAAACEAAQPGSRRRASGRQRLPRPGHDQLSDGW